MIGKCKINRIANPVGLRLIPNDPTPFVMVFKDISKNVFNFEI